MDTKRAINFLRNHFKIGIYKKISEEIIALIKQLDKKSIRGEKFEAIWNETHSKYADEIVGWTMRSVKQKYFPEGK